jgi:copper chaperone CopZ
VRSALSSLPGVTEVDVDYDAKTAMVHFDDEAPSAAAMAAALEEAGFGCSVAE